MRRDRAGLVVRFNGGAQAGHNVVLADGTHHTFAQFGAGTLVPGVRTHLGPAFVLHPGALAVEARVLAEKGVPDALERLTVDPQALVISPFQQAAGRLREIARGPERHGSCGVGVGEAVADAMAGEALRAGDLGDRVRVLHHLRDQQERKLAELGHVRGPGAEPEIALLEDAEAPDRVVAWWSTLAVPVRPLPGAEVTVFEGAQGALLDQTWGFHPHTTWSDCTPAGALTLAGGATRLGVVRAYTTRHGEGPFPTDDPAWARSLPERHNRSDGWQGRFRAGPLDLVLLRYAVRVAPVDGLAVTCVDRLADLDEVAVCDAYEMHPDDEDLFTPDGRDVRIGAPGDLTRQERLGRALRRVRPRLRAVDEAALLHAIDAIAPVRVVSRGPAAAHKHER